jgi:putative ABC transport system permease protein
MATFREWVTRLWSTLVPNRRDADLEQELQLHLELAAEDERRRHGIADDAARAAVLRAGAVTQAMDALRDQRGLPWLVDLAGDVRYAIRCLRRSPTFAAVSLLTLAVGIGANTAVFSVLNSVLLKPLAYPKPEQLVAIWHAAPGAPAVSSVSGNLRLSPSMYFTYAEQNRTFEHVGVWFAALAAVTDLGDPEQVRAVYVSQGTLQALGVQPTLGRWLAEADQKPDGPMTAVLSYGYWQRRFGGDRGVVGRMIMVESRSREIVGVMPPGFRVATADPDVILPFAFDRGRQTLPGFGLQAVARLKPGVTIDQASADVARMLPIWQSSWPAAPGASPRVYDSWRIAPALRPLKQDVVGNVGGVLWVVMATMGIVLLIACANVASLVLVRAEGRQQELAVRQALGARRGRLVRGLLIESLLLGFIGDVLGLLLAAIGLRVLVTSGPANLPRLAEIAIDSRAIGFTFVVSLLSVLLFGLIPALKYSGSRMPVRIGQATRTASHSRKTNRARDILVVAQVALALVLLVSSGLMIRSFQALRSVEPGFTEPQHLQTMRIAIPITVFAEPDRVGQAQRDIVDKLAAIPGVRSVGFASAMHMEPIVPNWDAIRVEGRPDAGNELPPVRLFKSISPDFFRTTGTRVIAGREYTWDDLQNHRPVVIISENLARELWGTPSDALGKRVQVSLVTAPWREVIGVVQDVRDNGAHAPAPSIVYWPSLGASPYRAGPTVVARIVTFAIRSEQAGTEAMMNGVRQAVWSVNANLPVASPRTMLEVYEQSMAQRSFTLVTLALAAAMAMVLGFVGIYGIISYAISQRTREIGIRLALGARGGELKRMFVRHGLALTGAGTIIGAGAAAGLTRLMSSMLFGVSAFDPATYLGVALVLVTIATLASYLPARHAADVDPVKALKAE